MSEFLTVAEHILRQRKTPMSPKTLTDIGFEEGLFSDRIAGKTPYQTMKSKLSMEVRNNGSASRFVRVRPGVFFLRELTEPSRVLKTKPLSRKKQEWVMVFDRAVLDRVSDFQGLRKEGRRYLNALLRTGECMAIPRLEAEATASVKQVLTYVLVTRGRQVLAFKRGSHDRVEAILRGAGCIGFGGHVTYSDRSLFSADDVGLWDSARRELLEELEMPPVDRVRLAQPDEVRLVGVINDDSSVVGERHIAFVFHYEVSDDPSWDRPTRGEKSISQLRWIDTDQDEVRLADFEYWSQLCLRAFFSEEISLSAEFTLRRRTRLRPPRVVVVCGQLGSGKTAAARVLAQKFGYRQVNSGHVLASLLGVEPIPVTPRDEFQERAWEFVRKPGAARRLAEAIIEEAVSEPGRIVIDGVRQRATLDALDDLARSEGLQGIGVLFVETPADIAWRLYRTRESQDIGAAEFYRLRMAPVEIEVPHLIEFADVVVHNWIGRSFEDAVVAAFDEANVPRKS